MLKILIVDDSDVKIRCVESVLSRYVEIPAGSWQVCSNLLEAKKCLREIEYDLLILDIQIPLRSGELPQREGGADLLREIHTRSCYLKPMCIVGLTEYEDLVGSFEKMFDGRLWGLVLYSQSSDEWIERLTSKIEYLLEKKKANGVDVQFGVDLGVLTALNIPELEGLLLLGDWKEVTFDTDPAHYWKTSFEAPGKHIDVVAAHSPQMGMVATAVSAMKLISHFKPKYLAMIGISAGEPSQVRIGDLVVADPCWDWGSGKLIGTPTGTIFSPEPLQERLCPSIRAMFEDVKRDRPLLESCWDKYGGAKPLHAPTLHIGPCASGACVLADGQKMASIKEGNRKLIGIDMEAYGLMHAACNSSQPSPMAFSMKAVCDYADSKKHDGYQVYGSHLSAAVLREIALKYF